MSGIPGLIGQLAGKLPIPLQVPVTIKVTWTVTKDGGTAIEGTDYLAPQGLVGPNLSLLFLPQLRELTSSPLSPVVRFRIGAEVVVQAFGVSSPPVTVPALPVDVPALVGVPTLLALFRHIDYAVSDSPGPGAVVLAVPANSGVRSADQLLPVLNSLQKVITKVQNLQTSVVSGNFATFLLGLDTLLNAVNSQPRFQYVVGNVSDLKTIKYRTSGWSVFPPALPSEDNANDDMSAVIVIGLPGNGVRLHGNADSERETGPHHMSLELRTGLGMWVTVRTFRFTSQSDVEPFPPTSIAGGPTVVVDNHISDHFNDKISAFEFLAPA